MMAARATFQIIAEQRASGTIAATHFLSSHGGRLGVQNVDDPHGAPASLLTASARAELQKLPPRLHNQDLILTSSVKTFSDPLSLKLERGAKLDVRPYQTDLVNRGVVRTYFKDRDMRFHPAGIWLLLKKLYLGSNGVKLIQLDGTAGKKELGITASEEFSQPILQFFILERGSTRTVIDLTPPSRFVGSGDYDHDGHGELIFLSGSANSGALSLVSDTGDILIRESWGDFDGP